MKKMFKMTLFKKIFLTVLCSILCVEVFHIYLDYQSVINMMITDKMISMEIRDETEITECTHYNRIDLLEDAMLEMTNKYEGYFLMLDKENHIVSESINRIHDANHNSIIFTPDVPLFNHFIDISEKINYGIHKFNFSMFDKETLHKIKDYIMNHGKEKIVVYMEYDMDENSSKIVKVNSLRFDDTVILGEGKKNEYPYIVDRYSDDDLYYYNNFYYCDLNNEEYQGIEFWHIEEKKEEMNTIYNEYFLNTIKEYQKLNSSRHSSIDSVKVGDNLYLMYFTLLNYDNLDVNRFINIIEYKDIFKNTLTDVLDEKTNAYILALASAILCSYIISYVITKRIKNINSITKEISKRNFENHLSEDSNDELGDLSKSINKMSDDLKNTIDELELENKKIKELESLRKDFINQFTHEMKTPLGIINGYSELIEETDNEEEKERYLDIINRETNRINNLIQSMLKLSRLEAGKVELDREELDLEDIITEVVDEYEILLMKKNIKVEADIRDKTINGDRNQIITVLRNFLSNAIKHTDTKIVITADKGVRVYNEGKYIEEERLESIWYTFVTHDKSGSGLGLAICRSILELHGYEYGVLNKDNGVEFYFYE